MSGTSKAVVSICVLLLAALVVYYGATPPASIDTGLVDLPAQRPSMFGGDPAEKLIAMGIPMPAVELNVNEKIDVPMELIPINPEVSVSPSLESTVVVTEPKPVEVEVKKHRLVTVLDGETLSEIAKRELGSSLKWSAIASLNNIDDPSRIRAGRVLRLPFEESKVASSNVLSVITLEGAISDAVHIVESGDTFSSIAEKYYNNRNKYLLLLRANPQAEPNRLKVGMLIKIPKQ